MALTLPNPNSPKNGDPLDATVIYQNQVAIAQAIQSFDASQIAAGTLSNHNAFSAALDPVTRTKEMLGNFVQSGCTWASVSGLQGTMAAGVIYIQGLRVTVAGVVAYTFGASQDTYIDVDLNGNVTYVAVANNATTGMPLTANSIRVAKVVSSASALTVFQVNLADPLGNIIYPQGAITAGGIQNAVKFSAYNTTGEAVTINTWQKINLGTKTFDTGNNFDTTNNRFTAPVSGFYFVTACIKVGNAGIGTTAYAVGALYKNGTVFRQGQQIQGSGNNNTLPTSQVIDIIPLVAGDYLEIYGYCSEGSRFVNGGQANTYMSGFLVSKS